MTKFRKGDVVNVRAVVTGNCSDGIHVNVTDRYRQSGCVIDPYYVTLVEPRKFEKGDRVCHYTAPDIFTVIGISNDYVWLRREKDDAYMTFTARHLRYAD